VTENYLRRGKYNEKQNNWESNLTPLDQLAHSSRPWQDAAESSHAGAKQGSLPLE
jgi:hypothetical protein